MTICQQPYQVPEVKRNAFEAEVDQILWDSFIEESYSSWSSQIVAVPKPDYDCNDYHKLNTVSVFGNYPLLCGGPDQPSREGPLHILSRPHERLVAGVVNS